MAAQLPPPPALPFHRAAEFGPLQAGTFTEQLGRITVPAPYGNYPYAPCQFFTASANGYISGSTLTVTATSQGVFSAGMSIDVYQSSISGSPTVQAFGTNSTTGTGGVGTYYLSGSPPDVGSSGLQVSFVSGINGSVRFIGYISSSVLSVTSILSGTISAGLTSIGYQPVATNTTILAFGTSGTTGTGGTGTYALSQACSTVGSSGSPVTVWGTIAPFSSADVGKVTLLPIGALGLQVIETISSVLGSATFLVSTAAVAGYSGGQPFTMRWGTDQTPAIESIHAAAYASGARFIWFDAGRYYAPGIGRGSSVNNGCGNVIFLGSGSSQLVDAYRKRIIRFADATSPGTDLSIGCSSRHFSATAATSTPVWVICGDSIATPGADQFTDMLTIQGQCKAKLVLEYPDKSITWYNRAIGSTSWRDLASTSAVGAVSTTFSCASGSTTITVGSSSGVVQQRNAIAPGYIQTNTVVTQVNGNTVTLSKPTLQAASGVTVNFTLTLPTWYTDTAATWWSYVQPLAPDGIVLFFGMNSDSSASDIQGFYTVLKNIASLPKVPDVVVFTPYIPSNVNTSSNSVWNQEARDQQAAITRGACQQKGYALMDLNEMWNNCRDGRTVRNTILSQPYTVYDNNTLGGYFIYIATGKMAYLPDSTTDFHLHLSTMAFSSLLTANSGVSIGIGPGAQNNVEIYGTAGGNYSVRVRLIDVAASPVTTTSTSSGAFSVASGSGIAVGQKIVSSLFSSGTTIASGSGTSWVASTNALSVATDSSATFSVVPVDRFDSGVPILTGNSELLVTVRENRVSVEAVQSISGQTIYTIFDGFVPRYGGLFSPRISYPGNGAVNTYISTYAFSNESDPSTIQYMPNMLDWEAFGTPSSNGNNMFAPYGGNQVNHAAEPAHAKVYTRLLSKERWR